MKRVFSLLLVLLLAVVLPMNAEAATIVDSGTCDENLTWTLDDEGTLTISGEGEMYGFIGPGFDPPWMSRRDSIISIVIQNGVTNIGYAAFSYCSNLTSVTIPDSVTRIDGEAFAGCSSLTSVVIPDSVTIIEDSAFARCNSLTEVTIPYSVTSIDRNAFFDCDNLSKIEVDADNLYYSSDSNGALYNKDKTVLVTWPGGDTDSAEIPSTVTSIGEYAFAAGNLVSVSIPASVSSIDHTAFYSCNNLIEIKVDADNLYYRSDRKGALYNKDKTKLIVWPRGATGSAEIPATVDCIGYEAFRGCAELTSIVIPHSVVCIKDLTFYGCDNLENVYFLGDAPQFDAYYGESFAFFNVTVTVYYPANNPTWTSDVMLNYGGTITWIPYEPRKGTCGDNLTWILDDEGTLTISGTGWMDSYFVNHMPSWNAYSSQIRSVVVENGALSIGSYAFYDCVNLTSVYIPKSVRRIGEAAFWYCGNLSTMGIPEEITSLGDRAFAECSSLSSITIPGTITDIGLTTFYNCTALKSIVFIGNAPTIEEDAFLYVTATAGYPANNTTWTSDMLQNYGGEITWVPYSPVKITQQPVSVTVAEGEMAVVTVGAVGDGLTYRWYYKNAGDSNYTYTSTYKGNTYSVPMTETRNGRWVLCRVYDQYGNVVQTNTVKLSMTSGPRIVTQPQNAYTQLGKKINIFVVAEGEGLTYDWYVKDVVDPAFVKSSITGSTYAPYMTENKAGRYGYCVITDKYGNSVRTNTVRMWLTATITQQPVSVTVAEGEMAVVTVGAVGDGLSYRWYYKNPGESTYTYTSTYTGNTYKVPMTEARNGRQVLCRVYDQYGNVVQTNTVKLSMASGPRIVTQPQNAYTQLGKKINIFVVAEGEGLTYDWYVKDVIDPEFVKSSITGSTYAPYMTENKAGRYGYCVITDKYGNSVRTNTVRMWLTATITQQPVSVTVAEGEMAVVTVGAVGDGLTYRWYYKNPGESNYTYTSTYTGNTYKVPMNEARNGRWVLCRVYDKYGNVVQTNTVVLRMK